MYADLSPKNTTHSQNPTFVHHIPPSDCKRIQYIAMYNSGLRETLTWQWVSSRAGPISLHPDSLSHMHGPNGFLQYRLREAWIFDSFQQWLGTDRPNAAACQHVRITVVCLEKSSARCSLLAFLTGAFVSPQCYQIQTVIPQRCPYCEPDAADLKHVIRESLDNLHIGPLLVEHGQASLTFSSTSQFTSCSRQREWTSC